MTILLLLEVAALTTGPDGDEDDEVADVSTICCEEACCFRLDPVPLISDRSIMARSDWNVTSDNPPLSHVKLVLGLDRPYPSCLGGILRPYREIVSTFVMPRATWDSVSISWNNIEFRPGSPEKKKRMPLTCKCIALDRSAKVGATGRDEPQIYGVAWRGLVHVAARYRRWSRYPGGPVNKTKVKWDISLSQLMNEKYLVDLLDDLERLELQEPVPKRESKTGKRTRPCRAPSSITKNIILKNVTKR